MKVRIRVVKIGCCFACAGQVVSVPGSRVLLETGLSGYGNDGRARRDAAAMARERGWEVLT